MHEGAIANGIFAPLVGIEILLLISDLTEIIRIALRAAVRILSATLPGLIRQGVRRTNGILWVFGLRHGCVPNKQAA